jgi:hypothetical protein
VTIEVGWRWSPYVTRDKDAMAAVKASLRKPTHNFLLCVVLDDIFVELLGFSAVLGGYRPLSRFSL